jgi:hypothetical protein
MDGLMSRRRGGVAVFLLSCLISGCGLTSTPPVDPRFGDLSKVAWVARLRVGSTQDDANGVAAELFEVPRPEQSPTALDLAPGVQRLSPGNASGDSSRYFVNFAFYENASVDLRRSLLIRVSGDPRVEIVEPGGAFAVYNK